MAKHAASAKADGDAKLAQEADSAATLKAYQAAEAALFPNQPAGRQNQPPVEGVVGGVHLQPLVQAILQCVGRNAPATLLVRVHSLPNLARTGGIPDGIADPMVAQL